MGHPVLSPPRSLELLFASSQNTKLLYGEPPKSPRATRKFSSPPPLSISKSSSPSRRRKLSLNIPIITGGKALDLAALSCSSNGCASMYSAMSPFSKTALDINKLYVSGNYSSKIPDEGEGPTDKPPEEVLLSKQSECLLGVGVGRQGQEPQPASPWGATCALAIHGGRGSLPADGLQSGWPDPARLDGGSHPSWPKKQPAIPVFGGKPQGDWVAPGPTAGRG